MRFEREAKTLASLNHPHIAQIYGLEQSSDVSALVMELVEGDDLAARLARGSMALDDAFPIARQIAEALETAHEAGIIHRDLKPANIKVRPDGTVKVLDFGLAKPGATGAASPTGATGSVGATGAVTSPAATMLGVILGTAAYMSPEQAKGKPVDRRADIWAFGCVLYEMLTGQRAFAGEDVTDTIASVVSKEPDWSRLPVSTPPSVRLLLQRCLEKDTNKRLPHIGVARLELDGTPARAALDASTSRGARSGRAGVIASVAMALAIGVAAGVWGAARWRSPAPVPIYRASLLLPRDGSLAQIAPTGRLAHRRPSRRRRRRGVLVAERSTDRVLFRWATAEGRRRRYRADFDCGEFRLSSTATARHLEQRRRHCRVTWWDVGPRVGGRRAP
jgi:hypothetical protein